MKKILLYVFALAGMMALSSCSSNEEELAVGKRPIVFGSVLADVHEGRATLATNLGGTIGIFGYKYGKDTWTGTTETPNFMYKEVATSTNNTTWTTANSYFWPDDNTKQLRFFGYAPASAFSGTNGTFASSATLGMPTFMGYTVPTNNAEQIDLMFGESNEYLSAGTGSVTINFHHILSAITFSLGANSAGTIQSVKLKGVPYTGTYSASTTGGSWAVEPVPGVGANEYSGGLSAVFLMIPQTLPSTARLEVAYTDGNSNGHTLTYSLNGITWQMGKKYDYTINIAENTITPTIVAWDTTISSEVEM